MKKLKLFSLFAAMLFATGMWAATVDLSTVTSDRTFQNGDVLQGTLSTMAKLSIADGATVTLNGVNINWGGSLAGGDFAGLNCLGNATIILADGSVNYVKGFMDGPSGIHVAPNYTVTIQGNGTLNVSTKGGGAAIGSGYSDQNGSRNAGNIVINGGTIYANGGNLGAGIGGGGRAKVGNITINGGIIFAVGGGTGAGIGGGQSKSSSWKSQVGNITISSSVRYLKATKGSGAAHSIGKGSSDYSVCGTVKVGNSTGAISTSPYVYCPPADNTKSLINAIGTVAHTEASKAKIDAARAAYDALEIQEMRDLVTNYSTLTDAEAAYNQLAASDVVAMIEAIGTVAHDEATRNKLDAIHEAYDMLTEAQKGLVTNYQTLLDAEAAYDALIPQPSSIPTEFAYCYDCSRDPAYPVASQSCQLSGFGSPMVGNKNPSGPWKLEFVELYNSANTSIYGFDMDSYVANMYGKSSDQMEVYRLYQWQDGAYQPVAYGVLYAYANENNPVEHAAFFEADGWLGCFLTGTPHSGGSINITFNEDATSGFADLHDGGGSTPSTPSWVLPGDEWDATTKTLTVNSNPEPSAYTQRPEIEHVIISSSVGTIDPEFCMGCSDLISATIGANVSIIGTLAFANCSDLTTITCEATTPPSLHPDVLYNSGNLSHIYVPAASVNAYKSAWPDFASIIVANGGGLIPSGLQVVEITVPASWEGNTSSLTVAEHMPGFEEVDSEFAKSWDGVPTDCFAFLIYEVVNGTHMYFHVFDHGVYIASEVAYFQLQNVYLDSQNGAKIFYTGTGGGSTPDPQPSGDIFAGFTATDGCGGFGGEEHAKLVDGLFASGNEGVDWTKWCADSQHKSVPSGESESCWWVDFNAANPIAVTGYILTTGNDNIPHGEGRNPSSWIIKAKLNESDPWTTIASVQNDNTMQVANFTDFAFDLDQAGTYKYFRFMVSAPVSGTCMQLCELRFTGNGAPAPTPTINDILQELYDALGSDVWAGYGEQTGVITYAQGAEANSFKATFMGGAYAIEIPFGDFTQAEKIDNGDGSYTYNLDVNLPAQTGLSHEVLHVTVINGEITGIHSDIAQTDMNKVGGAIASWSALQDAMTAGGVLQLSQSLTAEGTDGALIVPEGKTVVLDLNGFSLDRNLASAQADGSVIINNGTLAITDNVGGAEIKGGNNLGNGGGIVNNGTFTLYGGKITANHAAQGGGIYNSIANTASAGFWMTGGLIDGNDASSYPAIKGDVTFSNLAVVQISAGGNTVSAATAIANLATYAYIKPVMPNMDMFAILAELHNALGNDVWAGYGEQTGVITYAQGAEANAFKATFMGGAYAIEIPFGDFTQAEKIDNGDGSYTYNLDVNLPAQTGLSHEVLHVTVINGEITGIHSDIAQTDMNKVGGAIASWSALQDAMTAGGVLQLSQSLTAEGTDGALVVPEGKTVVLDLNGFSLDRNLSAAVADGSVIINNGTLAITDNVGGAEIKGGNNLGNGGGIVNNGTFTLYGGKITANHAAQGGGIYNSIANTASAGFWMTGGLIDGNDASSYPAIKGDVTFSNLAVVQISAQGNTVSAATAIAGLATLSYIKPVMPNMDMFAILAELHNALGSDVWAGYGEQTGVITYAQGAEANSFKATFMGGAYAIEIPFGDFTQAEKIDNGDGSYTYNLDVNLPAQTGLSHEVLHVTVINGEITGIHSDIAQTDMNKVGGAIASWSALNEAMANGGVLQLSQSLTAEGTDGALIVPEGKTVVLDLNGFSLDRNLSAAVADGSVIINNGTLAITDNVGGAEIKGGNNLGNGGGIVNNGTFTLYGGKITANHAAQGGGIYNSIANTASAGFWMTGGLIDGNDASSYPAIKGDVTFSNLAVVQISAQGNTVSAATAIAGLATLSYIKPVMPNMDMFAILAELHNALGSDVWAGYGEQTGVITYAQGAEANSFKATFMGGAYAIEIPFGDFTQAEKIDNGDGSYTYNLDVNLPAQTGLSHEVLHVTVINGEITGIHSDIAQTDMNKVGGAIASWSALQDAMTAGGVLQLSQSLTAEGTDGALVVPEGKTVVLDLNGFSLDRNLSAAVADGSVIINNGTLAITDNVGGAEIKGGNNLGNGGGIVNNGTFTLYGGKITANHAAQGGGIYNSIANTASAGFWMTGGLIDGNDASSYPAIKGDVTFSNLAVVQISAQGNTVSAATAIANLATYAYIKPVMPNMDMFAILAELHNALGSDVWAGYGEQTGVITYAQGAEANSFKATFMGGAYAIEIPFGDFTQAEKIDNGDGSYTYNLDVNLPAQTGLSHEVLHVTVINGEITGIHSDIAQTDMNKVGGAIASWSALQDAMTAGGVLQLSQSLTAEGTDGALVVPEGKTVVLDLNGFSLDRNLSAAVADGSVIINNGTLAITDNVGGAEIKGGNNLGNGGGIVNNGTFTLYGGKITANHAAQGGGIYNSIANTASAGFWMTGGLIDGNDASSYPAIKGDVTFSNLAVVQISAGGNTVSAATAIANLATYAYIKPVMPNMDMFAILAELHNALGSDVWAGYGEQTGVITYAQGAEANSFKATFMGGAYAIEIPFGDFTQAEKIDNGDGSYTYNLDVNLPAQTGLSHEVLHVTVINGEITGIHSDIAQTDMNKVGGAIASWSALQDAMTAGGVLQLSQSLTAEGTDGALIVPEGKTVVLDLNGFSLDRNLASAQANGSVIINNGTLAITDNVGGAEIKGGNNLGNGGGIVNNGTFTLYGGKITANHAAQGGGVYNSIANTASAGFWMTGGLIDGNDASSYPAIKGDVTFSNLAVVQVNEDGTKVSAKTAIAGLENYSYIQPVMADMDMFALLAELHTALADDVWTGYGALTGVISYAQGDEQNSFKATFMGGTYTIEIPFGDFTSVVKVDNGDGTYTYTLVVSLPAQTGMTSETLHVTMNSNGEITAMESENAGIELSKEEGPVTGWAALQAAMNQGGVIKLADNVVAESTDAALIIPEGKTVVLELEGYTIDRALTSAVADGSVIINNGTLAITGEGIITGGNTTGNGGAIVNNGTFTLYGGEITGNHADGFGGGVYNTVSNTDTEGFWMTGGLIKENTASTYPAIKGDVTFNDQAKVQIDADGTTVSIATATIGLDLYSYIKPVMPDYEEYDPATAIDNAAVNAKAVKVLRDGQILIIRDGKTYNAQGLLVK